MGDAMERNCGSCARGRALAGRNIACEKCVNYSLHKFPEEVEPGPITFVDKVKVKTQSHEDEYLSPMIGVAEKYYNEYKDKKFSLDKLIDDHWNYVEDMLRVHGTENDDGIKIVEFHYKSAFRHGYKHALERHNIQESNDE